MTLTLDHIRMTFDGHEVLRDVTVHVDDGRFVSLIGRSGCGKSTLLRVAAGLIEPTAGTVHADHDMAFGFRTPDWCRGSGCGTTSRSDCPGGAPNDASWHWMPWHGWD